MSVFVIYSLYVITSAWEVYLFLMQRASLDISRADSVDPKVGRHMLPLWYVTVWPNKLIRWVMLFFIWQAHSWLALLAAWGVVILLTTFAPVPIRHFLPMFHKKLSADIGDLARGFAPEGQAKIALQLHGALKNAEDRLSDKERTSNN